MIYLPAKNYNLPGPFGADGKFHPRFADGCSNGKLIIGFRRIVLIGIVTVMPAMMVDPFMPQILPVFLNPPLTVVEIMMPVVRRPPVVPMLFIIKRLVMPDDVRLVVSRPVKRTSAVMF
jgi:hypothetical protein